MRLILVAPTSDADAVGESKLAFEWVSRLAQRHDVTVLSYYQRSGRPLQPQLPGVRVVEWPEPRLVGRYERFNSMLNPGYLPFSRRARRWIREALAGGEHFDLGHQVAPVSIRYASPLAGTGLAYVLGPVGGGLTSPVSFRAEEGGAPWFTSLRALDALRLRRDPWLRRSFSGASCVLGIADYVAATLASVPVSDFRVLSDVGIDRLPASVAGSRRTEAVRFLFVGRLIRTKGVRDAVRALGRVPDGLATLEVVGEGYDRSACEDLAVALGISDRIRFRGHLPHREVLQRYAEADAFLFPSYREAGGIAVVEAMSYGLPVIVCDSGGPASTVDDSSGIRVPALDPDQYAGQLAEAICALASDPDHRQRLGAAGRHRIAEIGLWPKRVEFVEAIYAQVAAEARPGGPKRAHPGGGSGRG